MLSRDRPQQVGSPKSEDTMAKGQAKRNKEVKKPKAAKAETVASAYKQAQGKGTSASANPFVKKK
jgi:hypothetical protein